MSAIPAPDVTLPLTMFAQTPLALTDTKDVDEFLCRDQPVIHAREAGALQEAQLNASTDPEQAFLDLATALGGTPHETERRGEAPKRTVYMLELRLRASARIGTTSETEKAAQVLAVELASRREEETPHALWLPADDSWPGPRLRIVATKSLAEHFVLVRKTEIPSRLLQRGSSFPTTR